jgi:Holliday junction resolvase RusA-like endonuclease
MGAERKEVVLMMRWTEYATISVNGDPKPQPRARSFAMKGADGKHHARMYNPASAEGWKASIGMAFKLAGKIPEKPLSGPIRVDIAFYFKRPARLMRRKDPDDAIWCTEERNDRDNCDKAVLDALVHAGIIEDDGLVCDGALRKFYHSKCGCPGALLSIYTWS